MKCVIYVIIVDSIDEAIEQIWIPYFYEGEKIKPTCLQWLL